jgi:hypothetical protein
VLGDAESPLDLGQAAAGRYPGLSGMHRLAADRW